jgi:hypothetical protein
MKQAFELWDTETSNLVGLYPSQDAALAVVRHAVREYGTDAIRSIALGREDEDGELVPIAHGDDLIRLAQRPAMDSRPQRVRSHTIAVNRRRRIWRRLPATR